MNRDTVPSHKMLHRFHPAAGYALSYGFHAGDLNVRNRNSHWVSTRTNRFGFRSRDVPERNEVFRVLLLGDSFTFGFGVRDHETFPWLLDELLSEVLPGSDALNAGTTGTSNAQQIAYYESEGSRFSPDHVVLQVYVGNDIRQNWNHRNGVTSTFRYGRQQRRGGESIFRGSRGETAIYLSTGRLQRADERLYSTSHLYRELSDRMLQLPGIASGLEKLGFAATEPFQLSRSLVEQPVDSGDKLEHTCALVRGFHDRLDRAGVGLTVLPIPGFPPHRLDRTDQAFLGCLQRDGVAHIDPSFFMEGEAYYHMRNPAPQGHFDHGQNAIVASAIFRYLCGKFSRFSRQACDDASTLCSAFPSPLTCPRSITVLGPENDRLRDELANSPILDPARIRRVTASRDPSAWFDASGGRLPAGAAIDLRTLVDRDDHRVVFERQEPGPSRLQLQVDFDGPVDLRAVRLDTAGNPRRRVSYLAIRDGEGGQVLGLAGDPQVRFVREAGRLVRIAQLPDRAPSRSVFVTRLPGKPVSSIRVELFRPVETDGFAVRGLVFYTAP